MEISTKVHSYRYEYRCDSCPDGMMETTGYSREVGDKAMHYHLCDKCGAEQLLKKPYPRIRYIAEGEEL